MYDDGIWIKYISFPLWYPHQIKQIVELEDGNEYREGRKKKKKIRAREWEYGGEYGEDHGEDHGGIRRRKCMENM